MIGEAANGSGGVKKVGWLVSNLSFGVASTRYRAIYPAAGLAHGGFDCIVFDRPDRIRQMIGELSALVIVKRLDPSIIHSVSLANDAGVPVILDLCDDVLSIDYRDEAHEMFRMVFEAVAPRLSLVVTTGGILAERIALYGFPKDRIRIIPDCLESKDVIAFGRAFLERAAPAKEPAAHSPASRSLARVGGMIVRTAKAVRRPRRSALDWRRTLHTIRFGDDPPAGKPAAVIEDPDLRKALALDGRMVVWFGNHGGPHSDFGMLTLLKVANELRTAHAHSPFTLIVISDNKEKWKLFIDPIGVPTRFVPWTHEGCRRLLEKASAFIMPVGDDSFSLSKSANRALLSLEAGAPVVAQPLASLEELGLCVPSTEFAAALEHCLSDGPAARAKAAELNKRAHELYGLRRISEIWRQTLDEARPYVKQRARYGAALEDARLLVMINIAQDLPLALPILDEARRRGVDTAVIVGAEAARSGKPVLDAMIARKIAPTYMPANAMDRRDFRWLRSATALFCPTESSAPAHRLAHVLTKTANAAGVATFTCQHGLENIGLNHLDPEIGPVRFESRVIFAWTSPESFPEWLTPELRRRCIGAGRIANRALMEARTYRAPSDGPPIIAVFENLHWSRYGDPARAAFVDQLSRMARARPDCRIILMAHPGGRWAASQKSIELPANIEIVDPAGGENGRWTTHALIAAARAVITTPSTIAADAAEIGTPVAVAACGVGDLSAYRPLTLLTDDVDWMTFVGAALEGEKFPNDGEFLRRVRLPGDPIAEIVAHMCPSAEARTPQVSHFLRVN